LTKIFKSDSKILYLSSKTSIQKSGKFDVILSPQFYWVKRVSLPVSSLSGAKRLAQSIYEGSLPEGDFSYEVSKVDDEFIIIAYDKNSISSIISEKFTQDAKVSGIYFAQNEFLDLQGCCGIDETNSLVNINSLIMQVPRVCTESKKEISFFLENKKLSKNKITLGSFEDSVISLKEFYFVAAAVFILFSSFVIDWVNYSSSLANLEDKRTQIITKNDLPQTSMQLNSIKDSLTKTYKTQKSIRDAVFGFSKLNLKKGEYIEHISASSKEMIVVIKVNDKNRENEIKQRLSKTFKIKSSIFNEKHLTIKIAS